MKSLFHIIFTIPLLLTGSAFSQTHLGGRESWDARQQAAEKDLEEGVATKNYGLIKESAEALENLQKLRKAEAEKKPEETKVDLWQDGAFKKLQDKKWSLALSPEAGGSDKPAKFSWSKDIEAGTGTNFSAEFYLRHSLWNYSKENRDDFHNLATSVEGKLTENDINDAWRFRLEHQYWAPTRSQNSGITGFYWMNSLVEESDRDFDVARLGLETWFTVNATDAGIGQYQLLFGSPHVSARWRPYVGLNTGVWLADSGLPDDVDQDHLRVLARCTVDVSLDSLAKLMAVKSVTLFVDDTLGYLAESGDLNNYLKCGLNIGLSDIVGVGLNYSIGRDSPKYQREEELSAGFTVKF